LKLRIIAVDVVSERTLVIVSFLIENPSMTPSHTKSPAPEKPPRIPPLEPGDQLTRDEFERRYEAMPNLKKAELLEGVVHMPSPVRFLDHAEPHGVIIGVCFNYRVSTPGVRMGDNGTLRLDLDNEPQPDAAMFVDPACGGSVELTSDGYVAGAPELISEISASSVGIDLTTKLRVYRRNRVREYLVWRVLDREIDWFVLRQTQYDRLVPDSAGLLKSEVFPGLWLDPSALIQMDLPRVLQVLQQGIASPEHADFVTRLRDAAANA
jgi:hypothetical protein